MSLQPVSRNVNGLTGKLFSRKYIALGRILTYWTEIIGQDLAAKAQPVKIRYRKGGQGKNREAVLDVAVPSAQSSSLHFRKGLILERLNHILGPDTVTDIRFVHVPANRPLTGKKPSKPLTDEQKSYLSLVLDTVGDTEIRDRLARLGQHVINKN